MAKQVAEQILRKMQEYAIELQRDIVRSLEAAMIDKGLMAEEILHYTENNEVALDLD